MKKRILRPGKPAVTVHWSDDYSAPMETAYVSLEMDGDAPCMLTRWKVVGREATSAAYHAVTSKNLSALMDVLDEFTATLPRMQVDDDSLIDEAA